MNRIGLGALVVTASLTATTAHAQIVNNGFETGDFSGWAVAGTEVRGVATDGTALAGNYYADNVVNVRSGNLAAWAQVKGSPLVELVLSQSIAVEELRVYDVGFWQSLGRTDGTEGLGMRYSISVNGQVIAEKQNWPLDPGDDPESFLHEHVLYSTVAGQTTANVTFRLSGGGSASFGISYDDFHFDVTSACGDGVVHPTEGCDDGNLTDGDCCSSTCEVTNEGVPCNDGLWCTVGDICTDGSCVTTERDCSDADLCSADGCSEYTDECVHWEGPTPVSECLEAPRVKLLLGDSADPQEDVLSWKWLSGPAFDQTAVGTPASDTSYALCVYDNHFEYGPGSFIEELVMRADLPPSSVTWTERQPRGARYRDKTAAMDGITQVRLKTGRAGRTRMIVSAAGPNLALPGPATEETYFEMANQQFVVQLHNSNGQCWSSSFGYEDTLEDSSAGVRAQIR